VRATLKRNKTNVRYILQVYNLSDGEGGYVWMPDAGGDASVSFRDGLELVELIAQIQRVVENIETERAAA
jgi:hypothetical protein